MRRLCYIIFINEYGLIQFFIIYIKKKEIFKNGN